MSEYLDQIDPERLESGRRPLPPRELASELGIALVFLAALVALLALAPDGRPLDLGAAAIAVVVFAASAMVRFDMGAGFAVPTAVAFVPMCMLIPAALLPVATLCALLLCGIVETVAERRHPVRLVRCVADSSFSIGPALVLVAAGDRPLDELGLGVLALALLSPMVIDLVGFALRVRLSGEARDLTLWALLRDLLGVQVVDLALTPVGLLIAFGAADQPLLLLALLGLFGVLAGFARERRARLLQLVELNSAYRGTALVLGEVVEADDAYTGQHCRDVVDLATAVADELRLTAGDRRLVEFGALLHDVGKVAVPKSIINKQGPLDDEEWAIMRTHTVVGQRMLDRVGGAMSEVGAVVRSSHERWDGGGYPDRLAGEAIPLAARVVACCDAFNAMTTDRSYRAALPLQEAIDELRRNAGTQFDPAVVEAVLRIVEHEPASVPPAPAEPLLAAA